MTTPSLRSDTPRARGASARGALGIRWVATAVAVTLTVAAVAGVGVMSERNARAALAGEIRARLQLEARALAASSGSALLEEYPELTLHPLVREMRARQPELALVEVVDRHGRVEGDADARRLGTTFTPPAGLRSSDGVDPLARAELLRVSGDVLVARAPVLDPRGRVLGAAYVGMPLRHVADLLAASRRQQAWLLALLVVFGGALAFVAMSQLLRPMGALRAGLERIGRGVFDTPIALRDRTELGVLAESIDDMAQALARAQRELLDRERLAHELTLAREIQHGLLPARGLDAGPFRIRGDQHAAAEVGGDYWDVLPLPDGRIGIAIADVAGKGLAGCLVMSMLSALLRAFRDTHTSPAAMLAALDERLAESLRPGVFVTMCYAVLDPRSGVMTYASAGHNPLVVWRRDRGAVERRGSRGIPIGAVRGGAIRATLRDETLRLDPGDVCVQFTDGYTEAFRDGSEEQLGLERFEDTVERRAAEGGEAVLAALRAQVRGWSGDGVPSDDETLVVVSRALGAAVTIDAPGEGSADEREHDAALAALAAAERHGAGLAIAARLDQLGALDGWLRALPELPALGAERYERVRVAIYEVCANIVEHGCGEDGRAALELWWLPEPGANGAAPASGAGQFVIRDGGRPFRPPNPPATDFNDPAVRTRGRGIGLEIIHRAVDRVSYQPATARGNITLLAIHPRPTPAAKEGLAA